MICLGAAIFAIGIHLETRNPRSNIEDNIAWCVLAIGVALMGAGVGQKLAGWKGAILFAIVAPPYAFIGAVAIIWGLIILRAILS